jgi:hypothetical protein
MNFFQIAIYYIHIAFQNTFLLFFRGKFQNTLFWEINFRTLARVFVAWALSRAWTKAAHQQRAESKLPSSPSATGQDGGAPGSEPAHICSMWCCLGLRKFLVAFAACPARQIPGTSWLTIWAVIMCNKSSVMSDSRTNNQLAWYPTHMYVLWPLARKQHKPMERHLLDSLRYTPIWSEKSVGDF